MGEGGRPTVIRMTFMTTKVMDAKSLNFMETNIFNVLHCNIFQFIKFTEAYVYPIFEWRLSLQSFTEILPASFIYVSERGEGKLNNFTMFHINIINLY